MECDMETWWKEITKRKMLSHLHLCHTFLKLSTGLHWTMNNKAIKLSFLYDITQNVKEQQRLFILIYLIHLMIHYQVVYQLYPQDMLKNKQDGYLILLSILIFQILLNQVVKQYDHFHSNYILSVLNYLIL